MGCRQAAGRPQADRGQAAGGLQAAGRGAPVGLPPAAPHPPRPEKKFIKKRQSKKKIANYISEIVPKDFQFPIQGFVDHESDNDSDDNVHWMPALLPAGQVGGSESDDEHFDLPGLVTTDFESDYDHEGDGENDSDHDFIDHDNGGEVFSDDGDNPPGLLLKEDSGDEIYYSDEEEISYSSKCLTCPLTCSCTLDIPSSPDELVVGETTDHPAPSSALRKGRKKLEDLLSKTFTHETWKFGKLVQPNETDSDSDPDDPNIPFDWDSLSRTEKKKKLCEDLGLNNNPILNAEPSQRDRLQDLVVNYSDIFTDGLS